MSQEEVKDFECKITQTFALGQPVLAKIVLDAYQSGVDEETFKQTLLFASSNTKLSFELQSGIADCLKYCHKKVNFFERKRRRR